MAIWFVSPVHADPGGVRFDGFFGNLPACKEAAGLLEMYRIMELRYAGAEIGPSGRPEGRSGYPLKLPPDIAPGIGVASIDKVDNDVRVMVPLNGFYRGMRVTALYFNFGSVRPVHGIQLEFDAPRADVERRVAGDIREAYDRGRTPSGAGFRASAGMTGNERPVVYCERHF